MIVFFGYEVVGRNMFVCHGMVFFRSWNLQPGLGVERMTTEPKRHRLGVSLLSKSKLFSHFRAVGRVTNSVPAVMHYSGSVPYLTTAIGKSFQIFDVLSLRASDNMETLG